MADWRPVPSGLMAWPRVRPLPPCHKLVLYHLWASCESAAGCALVAPARLSADLGLPQAEVEQALAGLERCGLLRSDPRTAEVLIADWGRVHRVQSAASRRIWEAAISRIISPRLRRLAQKSMAYALERDRDEPGTGTVMPPPAPQQRRERRADGSSVVPPPPPWAACLEALRRRGVSGQRLRSAQQQLAALRTAEGGELSAADWSAVAEALARADDPAAWLRAVASSGWRRGSLAEAAYPGETAAQAKARLAQAGARPRQQQQPEPRAAEEARLRERLRRVSDFLAQHGQGGSQALAGQIESYRREAAELAARLAALEAEGVEGTGPLPRALH